MRSDDEGMLLDDGPAGTPVLLDGGVSSLCQGAHQVPPGGGTTPTPAPVTLQGTERHVRRRPLFSPPPFDISNSQVRPLVCEVLSAWVGRRCRRAGSWHLRRLRGGLPVEGMPRESRPSHRVLDADLLLPGPSRPADCGALVLLLLSHRATEVSARAAEGAPL